MPNAKMHELQARARFETLRRRVFDDMFRTSARARLVWILPFHALVIVSLIAGGESRGRALAQFAAVAALGLVFALRAATNDVRVRIASFVGGVACYFTFLATTGGLASPLLVIGPVTMAAAAIKLPDPPWLRKAVFASFLVGFTALAVLSRRSPGILDGPLAGEAGLASPTYVALAFLASAFAMTGVYGIGCAMTHGYERAALELSERREEVCRDTEERTRALEGMAARLAHEVKNPLAAIRALSTHMARNSTDVKSAERLAIVAAEADRLQSIVEGFLSFSRGLDDLKIAPTNLHEVARELVVLLETRAAEAGVVLDVAGDVDIVINADARKLRQALLNLVLNAIQASPSGATVRVAVAAGLGGARISVRDEGVGMTPEVVERIRKPHFTTKEGGTGLGVAVARGLVEQHGGGLEFESTPGKGTTALLALPIRAKPCSRLPNPANSLKHDEADKSEPAIVGAG